MSDPTVVVYCKPDSHTVGALQSGRGEVRMRGADGVCAVNAIYKARLASMSAVCVCDPVLISVVLG